MSTFKIEESKFLDWLIPERKWSALDFPTSEQIYTLLLGSDVFEENVTTFLKKKKPRIGFHEQHKTGAAWTFFGNITLAPRKMEKPLTAYELSLIIHEMYHISQPLLKRLSVQGELLAWQLQERTYPKIAGGKQIGVPGEAYGAGRGTRQFWDQLSKLSPDARADLDNARSVMKSLARGYRSDALPLYPLPQEIGFFLRHGKIRDAVHAARKLIHAAAEE